MGVIIQSDWIPINGAAAIKSFDHFTKEIDVQSASTVKASVIVESDTVQILGEFSIEVVDSRNTIGSQIPTTQTVDADATYPIALDNISPKFLNLEFVCAAGVGRIKFTVTYQR